MASDRFEKRKRTLAVVDQNFTKNEAADGIDSMNAFYERAYSMLPFKEAVEAFNIDAESDEVRDRYPAGGMAGAEDTFTLIGDALGPVVVTRGLPNTDGTVDLFHEDQTGISPTPIKLRASSFPNSLESEPNDTPHEATESIVELPVALNGILQQSGDVDQFRFSAKAGDSYDVNVFGQRIGSPIDTVVSISDSSGTLIVINDDGANHDSRFRFTAPATAEYTLAVRDHLGNGGADYVYRVEFQPVVPTLELAIPVLSEQNQQQRQRIQLPRGGRMAVIVSARRNNFLSDVQLSPDFLPEGVTVKASQISNSSHLGYLLFEATEDAPLTAGLFGINGIATVNAESVIGRLNQKTGLAFGPPRRTVYHAVDVDQLPIAVIENGPFQLDVAQPRVPLARDGQIDLQVTARRNNYDGVIKLTLPILPPWIEVPEDGVTIAAGQNAATYTITATKHAAPQEWTILMMGEGNIDGSDVFASSDEFSFTVVDPYLDITIDKAIARKNAAGTIQRQATWMKSKSDAPAIARLRGLPKDVEVSEVAVPPGSKSFAFNIDIGSETPASIHNTLYVEIEVPENGSSVRHFLERGGVLEVLAIGDEARDSRSRLQILRAQQQEQGRPITTSSSNQERRKAISGIKPDTRFTNGCVECKPEISRDKQVMIRTTLLLITAIGGASQADEVGVYPQSIQLSGARDFQSFVVHRVAETGLTTDATRSATLSIKDSSVAKLNGFKVVPLRDGQTQLVVESEGSTVEVPVVVNQAAVDTPLSFRLDVVPVLTRTGCNSGRCHGAARGKDGFSLSLYGFDPSGDYFRLAKEIPGRRINLAMPDASLILTKGTGTAPHSGGERFVEDSEYYATLRRWLKEGAHDDAHDIARPTGISMFPPEAVLAGEGKPQQLVVIAGYQLKPQQDDRTV